MELMKNALHLNSEALDASLRIEAGKAGAVFVDLDETILAGTVVDLSDEELENNPLIQETLNLIYQAKGLGIPVVMITRNNEKHINRFFSANPYLRGLFDEIIPCEIGQKSSPIKNCLKEKQIDPKNAVFIDDTSGELMDVERNTEGVHAFHPNQTNQIDLKNLEPENTEDLSQLTRKELISLLKKTPFLDERRKIIELLKSGSFADADQVKLAA